MSSSSRRDAEEQAPAVSREVALEALCGSLRLPPVGQGGGAGAPAPPTVYDVVLPWHEAHLRREQYGLHWAQPLAPALAFAPPGAPAPAWAAALGPSEAVYPLTRDAAAGRGSVPESIAIPAGTTVIDGGSPVGTPRPVGVVLRLAADGVPDQGAGGVRQSTWHMVHAALTAAGRRLWAQSRTRPAVLPAVDLPALLAGAGAVALGPWASAVALARAALPVGVLHPRPLFMHVEGAAEGVAAPRAGAAGRVVTPADQAVQAALAARDWGALLAPDGIVSSVQGWVGGDPAAPPNSGDPQYDVGAAEASKWAGYGDDRINAELLFRVLWPAWAAVVAPGAPVPPKAVAQVLSTTLAAAGHPAGSNCPEAARAAEDRTLALPAPPSGSGVPGLPPAPALPAPGAWVPPRGLGDWQLADGNYGLGHELPGEAGHAPPALLPDNVAARLMNHALLGVRRGQAVLYATGRPAQGAFLPAPPELQSGTLRATVAAQEALGLPLVQAVVPHAAATGDEVQEEPAATEAARRRAYLASLSDAREGRSTWRPPTVCHSAYQSKRNRRGRAVAAGGHSCVLEGIYSCRAAPSNQTRHDVENPTVTAQAGLLQTLPTMWAGPADPPLELVGVLDDASLEAHVALVEGLVATPAYTALAEAWGVWRPPLPAVAPWLCLLAQVPAPAPGAGADAPRPSQREAADALALLAHLQGVHDAGADLVEMRELAALRRLREAAEVYGLQVTQRLRLRAEAPELLAPQGEDDVLWLPPLAWHQAENWLHAASHFHYGVRLASARRQLRADEEAAQRAGRRAAPGAREETEEAVFKERRRAYRGRRAEREALIREGGWDPTARPLARRERRSRLLGHVGVAPYTYADDLDAQEEAAGHADAGEGATAEDGVQEDAVQQDDAGAWPPAPGAGPSVPSTRQSAGPAPPPPSWQRAGPSAGRGTGGVKRQREPEAALVAAARPPEWWPSQSQRQRQQPRLDDAPGASPGLLGDGTPDAGLGRAQRRAERGQLVPASPAPWAPVQPQGAMVRGAQEGASAWGRGASAGSARVPAWQALAEAGSAAPLPRAVAADVVRRARLQAVAGRAAQLEGAAPPGSRAQGRETALVSPAPPGGRVAALQARQAAADAALQRAAAAHFAAARAEARAGAQASAAPVPTRARLPLVATPPQMGDDSDRTLDRNERGEGADSDDTDDDFM